MRRDGVSLLCPVRYTVAMITVDDIAKALEEVVSSYDVSAVYLFGSYARDEQGPTSDVDIRLECGDGVGFGDLLDIKEQLEARLGRSVELITNPLEFMRPAFRERIEKDEVLLYEAA